MRNDDGDGMSSQPGGGGMGVECQTPTAVRAPRRISCYCGSFQLPNRTAVDDWLAVLCIASFFLVVAFHHFTKVDAPSATLQDALPSASHPAIHPFKRSLRTFQRYT